MNTKTDFNQIECRHRLDGDGHDEYWWELENGVYVVSSSTVGFVGFGTDRGGREYVIQHTDGRRHIVWGAMAFSIPMLVETGVLDDLGWKVIFDYPSHGDLVDENGNTIAWFDAGVKNAMHRAVGAAQDMVPRDEEYIGSRALAALCRD